MDKLSVYYDRKGNTLSAWFDDPKKEHVCEESDDDLILVKDRKGRVIGFERLNFLSAKQRKEARRCRWKCMWFDALFSHGRHGGIIHRSPLVVAVRVVSL
jgi:uncharacterized protein YuzE